MKHGKLLTAAMLAALFVIASGCVGGPRSDSAAPATREITRGGWVGMLIGGLEGLP